MGWNSIRRWPVAALLLAASLTSAAQQPAQQPSPAVQPPVAKPSPQPSSVAVAGRERVTVTGMVPIPDVGPGAPRYTSKDIEEIKQQSLTLAFRAESDAKRCANDRLKRQPCVEGQSPSFVGNIACEDEYATRAANLADKAAAATQAAEDVRREAAAGRASARDVEAAELKRQDAVNKMQTMRGKVDDVRAETAVAQEKMLSAGLWQSGERLSGADLQRAEDIMMSVWAEAPKRREAKGKFGPSRGLRIEGVRIAVQDDKTKPTVLVQGRIRNTGEESVEVPGLVAMLLDERDWVVARQSVTPNKDFVVDGKSSKPFGLEMKFAPQAAKRAMVAFAHEMEPPARLSVAAFCPPINPFR